MRAVDITNWTSKLTLKKKPKIFCFIIQPLKSTPNIQKYLYKIKNMLPHAMLFVHRLILYTLSINNIIQTLKSTPKNSVCNKAKP